MSILKYLKNMESDASMRKRIDIGVDTKPPPRREIRVIRLFTDGSEIKDNRTYKTLAVGWGVVVKDMGCAPKATTVIRRSGVIKDLRLGNNQRAELVAIHEGLKCVKAYIIDTLQIDLWNSTQKYDIELNVYTDSEYSMKCITTWSKTWEKNGWINSKKQPVKHQDVIKPIIILYKELSKLLKFNTSINHIRSHTGRVDSLSMGNSEADTLAGDAAKAYLRTASSSSTK